MRYTKREQVNTMDDMSQLQRAVENHKIDGLILGRTLIRDDRIKYLKQTDLPFVAIGSTEEPNVAQIDNDHIAACRELTSILIMKGMKKFALIGGDSNHVVNRTRREGFEQGITGAGLMIEDMKVYMDCVDRSNVEMAVEDSMRHIVDCIVCMDDGICKWVLDKLRKEGHICSGTDMPSFYNSALLENNRPAITSLQYDPKELGKTAGETLFRMIEGEDIADRILLGYEVTLKGSTQ